MAEPWLKLYKKIGEHAIMNDHKALVIFIWLLTHVDSNGKVTLSRYKTAFSLGIKPSSFYDALQRLTKKRHGVAEVTPKKDYSEVRLLHWAKYQPHLMPTEETPKSDRGNTEVSPTLIKEYKNKNILSKDNTSPVQEICLFYEKELNTKITNWGKQTKASKQMLNAGYTTDQIKKTILFMRDKDEFFKDKGFDLMTVLNQIPRYKSEFERRQNAVN